VKFLFNLGTQSGMPQYVAFLALVQLAIIFVPEAVWGELGISGVNFMENYQQHLPTFLQYYISSTNFKNAMLAFWILSPFTLTLCTYLYWLHANTIGYSDYLKRRNTRLAQVNKQTDYSLVLVAIACILVYVWSTFFLLQEPKVFGSFIPAKSRLAMAIVHAGAISLFFPVAITVIFTELRANLFNT
jgi:hypothetical protein